MARRKKRGKGDKLPNTLAKEWLEANGFVVDYVDRWVPGTNITKDWCGFADLAAVSKSGDPQGVVFVQATSEAHIRERVRKCKEAEAFHPVIRAGNEIWVMGFRKLVVHSSSGERMVKSKPIIRKFRKKRDE